MTQGYRFLGADCFLAALSLDRWTAFWTASALPGLSGTPDHINKASQSILALLRLRRNTRLEEMSAGRFCQAAPFL
jgi:hypothetical protein